MKQAEILVCLDGILMSSPYQASGWRGWKGERRIQWQQYRTEFYQSAELLFDPALLLRQPFDLFAMRRGIAFSEITMKWLRMRMGLRPTVYFLERAATFSTVLERKAQVINGHGYRVFLEPDARTAKHLTYLVPGCRVILFRPEDR